MSVKRKTKKLYQAQEGKCFHCDQPMDYGSVRKPLVPGHHTSNPNGWTCDHVKPASLGGKLGKDGYVLAHDSCNRERGNRVLNAEELAKAGRIWARAHLRWPKWWLAEIEGGK